jgi:hypothetical protein
MAAEYHKRNDVRQFAAQPSRANVIRTLTKAYSAEAGILHSVQVTSDILGQLRFDARMWVVRTRPSA